MADEFIHCPRYERNWSYVLGQHTSGVTEFTLCNIGDGLRNEARRLGVNGSYLKNIINLCPTRLRRTNFMSFAKFGAHNA
ncbi:hypothetical protein NK8_28470 [Caballeronia sp. NK8]|nr:hypothetical protein NK8_28470 [Caballeronia sp. NK8]